MGFVLELAELFAVGFEPAVEGEAEGAFDAGEVAAAVGDLGVAGGDGAGAPASPGGGGIVGAGREGGRGEGTAVAADEVGDGLFRVWREAVGHPDSIESESGFFKDNPDDSPDLVPPFQGRDEGAESGRSFFGAPGHCCAMS